MTVRLYPSGLQQASLRSYLGTACSIFNRCLEIRKIAWEKEKKSVTRFDQNKLLTDWRKQEEQLAKVPVQVERDAIRRVDLAFQHFFRRTKNKAAKVGYPRFKPGHRYNSFSIFQPGNCVRGGRIRVSGIDQPIRCRNLREIVGKIKQLRVLRKADKWFAQLVIESDDVRVEPKIVRKAVGIDVGLKVFATASDGTVVENPRFYRKLEKKLRRVSRVVSRKVKGSANRRKAVRRLQGVHLRIADARHNFTHHVSKRFANDYDLVAVEALNVTGMVRGRFGKSILDAAWSQFIGQLAYKVENTGGHFVRVDARGTSQECSKCGQVVRKSLSVRVHSCSYCGLIVDRDQNASRNILQRAIFAPAPGRGVAACGAAIEPQ